jgi:alcohol dehydrogenase
MMMLPAYWEYTLPTRIVAGSGCLRDLEKEILAAGKKKVFLITDKNLEDLRYTDKIAALLQKVELVGVFDEVTPDSEVKLAERGALLARQAGADYLLALGGGSCIDTAKGINIVLSLGGSLLDYEGFNQINRPLTPLGVIPTTAGTGSEVTQFAVILNRELNQKITFLSPHITPALALLDPDLTLSLPPNLTASTGMDALGHAVEAFVSTSTNPLSQGLACEAAALIFTYLEKACREGSNIQYRLGMLMASNLAGLAFSSTMVGCAHALAHALGGLKNVPHALAVGLLLPHGILFNGAGDGYQLYEGLTMRLFGVKGQDAPDVLADKIWQLMAKCRLPLRLSELGVAREDLPAVAELAAIDGAMYTNPREAGEEELLAVLSKAY